MKHFYAIPHVPEFFSQCGPNFDKTGLRSFNVTAGSWSLNAIEKSLKARLHREIIILDGGMGTMIQQLTLAESDFRGETFAKHHQDLKGNNDILNLS